MFVRAALQKGSISTNDEKCQTCHQLLTSIDSPILLLLAARSFFLLVTDNTAVDTLVGAAACGGLTLGGYANSDGLAFDLNLKIGICWFIKGWVGFSFFFSFDEILLSSLL